MLSPSEKPLRIRPGDLLIRRMRAQDLADIMDIESVSFGRHHWSDDSFLTELRNELGRYYSLVDTTTSRVVGYCGYWLILDEAHITTIAVHPDLRGQSLGEILLLQMLDRCLGQTVHWVTLEVRVTNTGAQNLYYKYGFQSAGTRPKYYQDNSEDALIMTTGDILSPAFRAQYNRNRDALKDRLGGLPQGFGQ